MSLYASPRRFRLEALRVGHRLVCIRSPRSADSENVDLMFTDVFYMEVSFDLATGLEIEWPTDAELEYLTRRCGVVPTKTARYYVLVSGDQRYYISAWCLHIYQNTLPSGIDILNPDYPGYKNELILAL